MEGAVSFEGDVARRTVGCGSLERLPAHTLNQRKDTQLRGHGQNGLELGLHVVHRGHEEGQALRVLFNPSK